MISLYTHPSSPNGWIVSIVLNELGLEHQTRLLDFRRGDQRSSGYLKINPNGRIPAIIDHNNDDFTLWESSAIVQYLVDRYDTERRISFTPGSPEYYLASQWIAFQASGQGPYFAQAGWFWRLHPEKIPSVIARYLNEIDRITGVLDDVLSSRRYLVGNRISIADLVFVPWSRASFDLTEESWIDLEKYRNFTRWNGDLGARPSVARAFADADRLAAPMS